MDQRAAPVQRGQQDSERPTLARTTIPCTVMRIDRTSENGSAGRPLDLSARARAMSWQTMSPTPDGRQRRVGEHW